MYTHMYIYIFIEAHIYSPYMYTHMKIFILFYKCIFTVHIDTNIYTSDSQTVTRSSNQIEKKKSKKNQIFY